MNTLKHNYETFQHAKQLLYTDTGTHIESLSLTEVCATLDISPSTLRNLFHKHMGISPRNYVIQKKMFAMKTLLHTSDMNITDIGIYIGYENFSKMSSRFKTVYGLTPTQYKQNITQKTLA